LAEQSEGSSSSLLIVAPALEGRHFPLRAPATACRSCEGKEHDDMTIRLRAQRTDGGRSRYRARAARWPHVGECTFAGAAVLDMIKQRDGGRVSAAGDGR